MTSANKSQIGLAIQTAKGTPNVTDGAFKYFSYSRGGMGVANQFLPAEDGVGAGSLTTDVDKVGVFSQGQFEMVARPDTLGMFLYGALGKKAVIADGTGFKHTFTIDPADEFSLPYFTFRQSPGRLGGEQFQDCRINGLTFEFQAAQRVRTTLGAIGGLPAPAAASSWAGSIDLGPTFLAPVSSISGISGISKVLRGSLSLGSAIPLDEQWIIGSYSPDDFDVARRQVMINLIMKITDTVLYKKATYDPAGGASWLAEILKDGGLTITFQSPQTYDTGRNYKMVFTANADADNVAWAIQPLVSQADRQVIANITGTVLAVEDISAADPITVDLYNKTATYLPTGFTA